MCLINLKDYMEVIKFREAKYYKKNIQTRGGILSWDKIGFNDVK